MTIIYLVVIGILIVLFFWTKNNIKSIGDTNLAIKMVIIATIGVLITTLIIFGISKIGINYPNIKIYKEVRKVVLMLFIPINTLISLPTIIKIIGDIENKEIDNEKIKKRIIIFGGVILFAIINEIIYIKDFQNGIIELLNK